jgi:hypothetical protein
VIHRWTEALREWCRQRNNTYNATSPFSFPFFCVARHILRLIWWQFWAEVTSKNCQSREHNHRGEVQAIRSSARSRPGSFTSVS